MDPKKLSSIRIEGYRSLKQVELAPGPITVLIGPNGSGKSNLLSLLRAVPLLRTGHLRRVVGEAGGASTWLHYGPQATREINIRLEFAQDSGANAYSARLGYAAGDSLVFLDETVEYRANGSSEFRVTSLGAGHFESRLEAEARDPQNKTARVLRWWLARMNFFHFHDTSATSPLRQNSRQEDVRFLRSDGSNLAAYLRGLAIGEGESFRKAWTRISELVRQVAPYIVELQPTLVDPSKPQASAVRLDWTDERGYVFGPHYLSDGTLRAIALITALAQPVETLPAFISIDEPELGLHPAALVLFAALVRSVAPHCQVLLATQSPALLDLFEPDEVVVAERVQGATSLRRLSSEALSEWLEDYSLSELYDKNVLGGRP